MLVIKKHNIEKKTKKNEGENGVNLGESVESGWLQDGRSVGSELIGHKVSTHARPLAPRPPYPVPLPRVPLAPRPPYPVPLPRVCRVIVIDVLSAGIVEIWLALYQR